MAGQKGRSGGARPGAGRKPKPPEYRDIPAKGSPIEFLESVMNDNAVDLALRVKAAGLAAQYRHRKASDGGLGEERKKKAEEAGSGKFSPAAPPKLVAHNGGKP